MLSCSGSESDTQNVGKYTQVLISKYGYMASFSTTSVVKDIASFMDEYTNGQDTIVFGWSYGTMLEERLIHLDPPQGTWYVFDGIAASMGAQTTAFPYYSNWDMDFGEVANKVLAMCQKNKEIAIRFEKKGLAGTIKHLIAQFDKDPESPCARIVNGLSSSTDASTTGSGGTETEPASFALRFVLGAMLLDSETRKLILPVMYRLNRCADEDLGILERAVQVIQNPTNGKVEDVSNHAMFLFNVIIFSEMW